MRQWWRWAGARGAAGEGAKERKVEKLGKQPDSKEKTEEEIDK
jgi:hypothetical protein